MQTTFGTGPGSQGKHGSGFHRCADRAWQPSPLLRQGRPPDQRSGRGPGAVHRRHSRPRRLQADQRSVRPQGRRRHPDPGGDAAARRRWTAIPPSAASAPTNSPSSIRWCSREEAAAEKRAHADRDPVGALRCRRTHGRLSASVGCSLFYSGDETTEILVNKAETALYHAKRSGRGRVVVYTREMEEAAKRVTRIEQALRRAVSAGEVEPHFQPIVDLEHPPHHRLRDAGALDRSRPRHRAAERLHPHRRGARHHRPAVAAGAAQGHRSGAQLAEATCSCPSTCRRRSSSTRIPACTSWRSSTAPASIRAGWRSRSPRPA